MDRDTKLIAILRRQYHIILTALGENIFLIGRSDGAQYGIYFLPTCRQYDVVLPSQNRNLFLKTPTANASLEGETFSPIFLRLNNSYM